MIVFKLKPLVLTMAAFTYSVCTLQVAFADDTEIYVPKFISADEQVRPNILFVLDSSGSMDATVSGSGGKNRNEVMHEVVNNLIDKLKSDANVNIGFMRYGGAYRDGKKWKDSNEYGGHVIYPVKHLADDKVAKEMKEIVKKVNMSDWTPLLETYYESYRYFTGQARYFSGDRNHKNSIVGENFISPISHSCQPSHIIYITDGEPTRDVGANQLINNLVKNKSYNNVARQCDTNVDGGCLTQLAAYMANEDMAPDLDIKQTITSHFIGFAIDKAFLSAAARAGGGQYLTSNNASGLADALQSIVADITAQNSTFVAPSVAVSAYNNLGFRNELYYALFRPASGANWPGNVKKYKLITTEDSDGKLNSIIADQNNQSAIDDATGFFKESASSFWSSGADGADIAKGGAAVKLKDRTDRKIYTWHGGDKAAGSVAESLKDFKTSTSTQITNIMLGASNGTERANIVNWIINNAGRMGDVLHNEPRLVAYKTDEDLVRANTSGSQEDLVMFVGSNEGFIHAIDPKNGNELYSFIPKELLNIPAKYLADNKSALNKAYGMDGFISVWSEYGPTTGNTKTATKINLYAGMRRGGSNYYALDVTSKNDPKLKWVIKGAYNSSKEITTGFDKLGLTFSAPKLTSVKVGGVKTKVLIFSGGYDKEHDNINYNVGKDTFDNIPRNDTVGNALYIVNAETGALLWRAGGSNSDADLKLTSMTNSMPASPTLVDRDGDGLADIIYASDLRGQIFRFDINNSAATLKSAVSGVRLAQLAGSTAADNRRFFNSPDVALIRDSGKKPYFTVSIGSGFRASPLNEQTNDRFYMIRDSYVDGARPASASVVTEATLTDVSATVPGGSTAVYTEIDKLETKIKALNANVVSAQEAYLQHKKDIGYTDAYDQYLALYNQSQQLQREIDQLTDFPYDDFDPAQWDNGKPSNSLFLEEHVVEAQNKSELQSAIVAAQQAFNALYPYDTPYNPVSDPDAAKLANLYSAMLALQVEADAHAGQLIKQENFLLKGNSNPSWTPELIAQTQSLFPSVSFDPASGDFSDYSSAFSAQIDVNHLAYKSSPTYVDRDVFKAVTDVLIDLSKEGADRVALLASLDSALNGVPIGSAPSNINDLLVLDQTSKQQSLDADVANYKTTSDLIQQKTVEKAAVLIEQQAALASANDIEDAGGFQAYQKAIDDAYAAAADTSTGIPALRAEMNAQYALLDLASGTISSAQAESLRTSDGFYLRLVRGEKVLADSVSFRGTVLFSTFSPRGQKTSVCGSDVGSGRVYALSLRDSKGMFTKEVNGVETPLRSLDLLRAGIPPSPSVIVTGKGPVVIVGTEILDLDAGLPVTATHWREK